jgi:hypothetical protein
MNTGEEAMNINNDADMEAVKKDCDRDPPPPAEPKAGGIADLLRDDENLNFNLKVALDANKVVFEENAALQKRIDNVIECLNRDDLGDVIIASIKDQIINYLTSNGKQPEKTSSGEGT